MTRTGGARRRREIGRVRLSEEPDGCVGIAFVPIHGERGAFYSESGGLTGRFRQDPLQFDETLRRSLLEQVAAAFEGRPEIASIEVLPSHQLREQGGFEEVDRLGALYGLDLLALVSYDQIQFGRENANAWTYLTLVGALTVEADETETRTLLDTSVFDIRSRTLLVTATGTSAETARSTPFETQRAVRIAATSGFEVAAKDLITNLDQGLERMAENVRAGTARGPGSPAVQVKVRPGNHGVAGLGWVHLLLLAIVGLACRREA
ncbi:rhombotarget lipoprotein [Saltatorellus ferox]|uniref:rhombotarget lipoprotein n=1 Tax=Saltatorellus ferox TaxID=2528018 RepID=UPI003AF36A33